jgi:uncharacterized protein YjlB
MTIMATHFALVLGAWRLRIRIDLDEPRESELKDERAPQAQVAAPATHPVYPQIATWGRG